MRWGSKAMRGGVVLGASLVMLLGCQPRGGEENQVVSIVRNNDAQTLQAYLESGGDPDVVDKDGLPLIYIAAGPRGGIDVLRLLIAADADIEATEPEGRTALMNAAGWCAADMVVALLEAGADQAKTDDQGRTARDSVCAGPLDRRAQVLDIFESTR